MDFIRLDEHITLSEVKAQDIAAMVEYLNEKDIYDNTLAIPFPYTEEDGVFIVDYFKNKKQENNRTVNWAIRNKEAKLIGVIGFHEGFQGHKAEIGYWLAKPYWGKGIMTKAIAKVCEIAFDECGLYRITANVFEHNQASARVLEKNGFVLEAPCVKNYYQKDGKIFNGKLYALTK